MNIVTIIPARGGSKGVPLKNIRKVGGLPLINRAVKSSINCKRVNKTFVATDSIQIAESAKKDGAEIIWRTAEISNDTASSESVLQFCLERMDEMPDVVVFLQCTSPFIRPEYITRVIDRLEKEQADSALAVVGNHHFIWRNDETNTAVGVNHDGKNRLRRQDLPPEYLETGAIYVFRVKKFLEEKTRFCGKTVIENFDDELLGFEIDSLTDLKIAGALADDVKNSKNKTLLKDIALLVFDFDGVFTDNSVYVTENGDETVRCDRGDGLGIELLKKYRPDISLLVLSKETNKVVGARCRKLKIDCLNGVDGKFETLVRISKERGVDLSKIGYIGNDINDLECMEKVGVSICPSDAYKEVKLISKIVLKRKGGNGAVRELVDLIMGK